MSRARFSRRHFFYGSLLAGAVPAGGFRQHALAAGRRYKSINEKLNIASIGAGTRAQGILPGAAVTENIVAVCDVDQVRAARVFAMYPQCHEIQGLPEECSTRKARISTP